MMAESTETASKAGLDGTLENPVSDRTAEYE